MAKIRNPIIVGESVDFSEMDNLLDDMEDLLDELDNNINGAYVREIQPYLEFSSPNSFTLSVNNSTKNWDGTLEYSTDTTNWSTWNGVDVLASDLVGGEYVLYLRGIGNTVISGADFPNFTLTGVANEIECQGNIENLLDYQMVANNQHPPMASYAFSALFYGCDKLVTIPELPSTTLTDYCYGFMFYNCTSLTSAPALPATTLAEGCYESMFEGCTSLISIPSLTALNLEERCYINMFYGCFSIKLSETQTGEYQTPYRVPSSGNGVIATSALNNMFSGTSGTFTGTPIINTTYYLSNTNSVVTANS